MYKDTFKMVDGDMVIENGDFVIVSGHDELRQNIENRYGINKDEWFLNIELGLDYSMIQGKGISDSQIELAIRECGLQDSRVKEVLNVETTREYRHTDIAFTLVDREDEEYKQEVVDID